MMPNFNQTRRLLPQTFAILVLLASIALLIWSAVYTTRPGPSTYYSHFSGLFFACSSTFSAIQLLLVCHLSWPKAKNPFAHIILVSFSYLYWAVLILSGLICGICYGISSKPDCVGIQVTILLIAVAGLFVVHHNRTYTAELRRVGSTGAITRLRTDDQDTSTHETNHSRQGDWDFQSNPWSPNFLIGKNYRQVLQSLLRYVNCFLKTIHCGICILFIVGAINLALTYRFPNPGSTQTVTLPDGNTLIINYHCTSVNSTNATSLPTIWLEADVAHGVVDFLGLQTALADIHGRNSCSYDPPNFGWSSRLPASESTFFAWFDPLLSSIGRRSEDKVLVGWAAGAKNALMHALADDQTTKALVLLDVGPDGIEWSDKQRAMNWTNEQMLQYRETDLAGRIELAKLILALGIPWGLMPIFIPQNSTGYFDPSLYPRYRAQIMKEDMWAMQYYALLQMAASPIDEYLANTTVPTGMPTYTIMTYNSGIDEASNAFYRQQKTQFANHVSGGNLSKPIIWCTAPDCSLSFPVDKSVWTAEMIVSFGI